MQEKLERVILGSKAAQQQPEVRDLWQTCGELMFSLEPKLRHLGLGNEVSLTMQELGRLEGIPEAAWYAWKGQLMGGRGSSSLWLKPLGTTGLLVICKMGRDWME